LRWMRWSMHCGSDVADASTGWCITPTAAFKVDSIGRRNTL